MLTIHSNALKYDVDRKISFMLCAQIGIMGIKNIFAQAIPFVYNNNVDINMFLLFLIAVIYGCAIFTSQRRMQYVSGFVLFLFFFVAASMMISAFFFPGDGKVIISWLPRSVPFCFASFYLISRLRTVRWIAYYMVRLSYLIIIAAIIGMLFIRYYGHTTYSDWSTYSMPMSYVTMLGVMWLLYDFFRKENFAELLFVIIGGYIIVFYGSRNPLLAILTYIVINICRKIMKGEYQEKVLYFGIICICANLIFNYKLILSNLANKGINSRTISLILQNAFDTSGRSEIHEKIFYYLNNHLLVGLGVGGDLALTGAQSHGLFMSILSTYGYLLGPFVIIIILFICFIALKKSSGLNRDVVLIYICCVIPRGFTGLDIWTSDIVWWMLGICFIELRKSNEKLFITEVDMKWETQ